MVENDFVAASVARKVMDAYFELKTKTTVIVPPDESEQLALTEFPLPNGHSSVGAVETMTKVKTTL